MAKQRLGVKLKFYNMLGRTVWYSKLYEDKTVKEFEDIIEEAREKGFKYYNSNDTREMMSKELVNTTIITIIDVWK